MAAILALAVVQENTRIQRNRFTRNIINCFDIDDVEFIKNFRLEKSLVRQLVEELRPRLEVKTTRRDAVSVEGKVLCALRFFASGSYQRSVANEYMCTMTQQAASSCIRQVTEAMLMLMPKYIKFPASRREQEEKKIAFSNYCGLTGVIGAIDCTHIAIVAPSDDGFHNEKNYVNRKGFHSVNVQLVCDMNMEILNIVARFPGSTHDAYIWRCSKLRRYFENNNLIHGNGWLLGDSGYPEERWLHVPFPNPSVSQLRYNNCHSRGRAVIERCNGVLKTRFRCLLRHRTLHYTPEMAAKIAIACAILHNMCIRNEMIWEDWELPEEDELFDTTED